MEFVSSLALLCALSLQYSDPVISEFMASNDETLEDEDGDSPDWVEIHNPTAASVDLSGWFLSDDSKNQKKWEFPSPTILDAGANLVVFASEKNRRVPGLPLHTNFKLKSEGEYLGLFAPNSSVRHHYSPAYPQQYLDVAYGLSFQSGSATSVEQFFVAPTPGSDNGIGGPALVHLEQTPKVPTINDALLVRAVAAPARGASLASVFLRYRVMYDNGLRIDMFDDGTGGDTIAGDGIFSGLIPAGVAQPGQMLRWLVHAQDASGPESIVPTYLDPLDSPAFFGTVVEDPAIVSALPVYHWFAKNPDRADQPSGTRCSLFFAGDFYDNVLIHPRGGSTEGMPKKPFKFNFNSRHHLRWKPDAPKVDEVNFNSTWSDKAYVRQNLSFETYQLADVHGSVSFPVRLELNGEFYSVAVFVEEPEEELLERLGLDPDGALYKMYNPCNGTGSTEKKTREWEDNGDLAALVDGLQLLDEELQGFLFDAVDLPKAISYVAATNLIHDNDHVAKNYYLYRDSDGDQEWECLPWDKDLTFGRHWSSSDGLYSDDMWADDDPMSSPFYGDYNYFIAALFRDPRTREMYVRRIRSLMDQYLDRRSVSYAERHFEARCEELYALMKPDVDLDAARWGVPNWGDPMDFRTGLDQLIQKYLSPRRRHLFQTHVENGNLPEEQIHPHVRFGTIERDPPGGNQDEEYVEVVNPNALAVDLSGWTLRGDVDFTFAGGSVIPAFDSAFVSPSLRTFRNRAASPRGGEKRLVLGPYQGHLEIDAVDLMDRDGTTIAHSAGLFLSSSDFVSGESGRLVVSGSEAGAGVAFLYSLSGAGPIDTTLGTLHLSLPFFLLGVLYADAAGATELDLPLPPEAAGFTLFFDAIDAQTREITNGVGVTVQ